MRNSRIPILENRIDELAEDTDPCDLYTVLSVIADHLDQFSEEFIQSSLYSDIIHATQSNPKKSDNRIRRIVRMDNAIIRYDGE